MNQVNELRKGRRNLRAHQEQEAQACKVDIYRQQLQDVDEEPGSQWMDERCRRYSLNWLLYHVIKEDRAHRSARGYSDAR